MQLKRKKTNGEYIKPTTVIHYHAIIRLALCHARKMEYIDKNPMELVVKPTKNQFVESFYSVDEFNELIRVTKENQVRTSGYFRRFLWIKKK